MPIEMKDESTWVLMGTGDIAMCGAAEEHGDRQYVILQQHTPGEQGHEDEVDREFPIQDGWTAGSGGLCVALEFMNPAALEQLVLTLMGHGDRKFPGDMAVIEIALAARERPDGA